ncbi:conserved hypothetical protein [Ricinus communis]|uniref:Ankyrin repeat-containing protein n=1 Tax=Ricinus communis TaxID=3988 RepID=B9SKK9_RICCO|nr:conserved hypothetical protein [Ricinus communis]
MNSMLFEAALAGNVNVLHQLFSENQDVLVDAVMTTDCNPLHAAAKHEQGWTHSASLRNYSWKDDIIDELLNKFKDCLEVVTARGETALHLALKHDQDKAFLVLMNWVKQTSNESLLGWKDKADNTVLHLACSKKNIKAIAITANLVTMNKVSTVESLILVLILSTIIFFDCTVAAFRKLGNSTLNAVNSWIRCFQNQKGKKKLKSLQAQRVFCIFMLFVCLVYTMNVTAYLSVKLHGKDGYAVAISRSTIAVLRSKVIQAIIGCATVITTSFTESEIPLQHTWFLYFLCSLVQGVSSR